MKVRKLLSIIMCMAVTIIAMHMTPAFAEETPGTEVYVQSVTASQGSSVDVTVGIRNAVDLAGLDMSIFYDADALTVESANKGWFVDGASAGINTNTAGTVKETFMSLDGFNGDGDLMTIRFQIAEDALLKDYDLAIGIGEAYNTSFGQLTIQRRPGKVTVTKNQSVLREAYFYSYAEPSEAVSQGDEVHYKVIANDANGLAGGTFEFIYDREVLEFVNATLGSELISDTAIYSVNSKNPGLVKISYAEIEAITQNYGVLFFDITFRVRQNTSTSTTINFSGSSLLDANLVSMTTTGASTSIQIEKKRSKFYVDWDGETGDDRKFTVDVMLTGDSKVAAGDFWVEYDISKLRCDSVVTDPSVASSGAMIVTKEDTSNGKISFSYVNTNGCSTDSTLLHITFEQLHGIIGDTSFIPGGKKVVDTGLNDLNLIYPTKYITMPYPTPEEIEKAEAAEDLNTAVTEAKAVSNADGKYTAESYQALQDAIDEAERVAVDPQSTAADLRAALAAVETAKAGLVEEHSQDEIDKAEAAEELDTAVTNAKTITNSDGKYSAESYKALQDAIAEAERVAADPASTADDIRAALAAVETAKAGLVDLTKQMGTDGTPVGKGASEVAADKAITGMTTDKDPAGTAFGLLQLKSTKQTNTAVTLAWKKVTGATKYIVYGNQCGNTNRMKKQFTINGASRKVTSVIGNNNKVAKLKKGTYYKFIVVAVDRSGKVVSTSKVIHVATKGGKVGNHKKVTTKAKKNKVAIKKGKNFKLAGKAVPASKKLKVKKHRGIAYESSNPAIATVSSKGVIKGKKKGTCYVYAYAQNGVTVKIKVTVK